MESDPQGGETSGMGERSRMLLDGLPDEAASPEIRARGNDLPERGLPWALTYLADHSYAGKHDAMTEGRGILWLHLSRLAAPGWSRQRKN